MRFVGYFVGLSVILGLAGVGQAQEPVRLIRDIAVVEVQSGTVTEHRDVHISNEQIAFVESTAPSSEESSDVINGSGLFLIPGLWNFHAHLTLEENDGYAERSLDDFVPNGVLTAVDMGGDLDRLNTWRDEIVRGERLGPRIIAAGPFIDGAKTLDGSERMNQWRRANMRVITAASEIPPLVRELAPRVDVFKVHSRLPREAFFALAREATNIGKPLVVHLPVGIEPLEAVRAGANTIEHVTSFLGDSIYLDDPTAIEEAIDQALEHLNSIQGEELLRGVARSDTCVTLNILVTTRFLREQGTPFFDRVASELEQLTVRLSEYGATLLAGSDAAGELYGLTEAEDLVLELEHLASLGIPDAEVLQTATLNPASCLGLDNAGRISSGASADLVLLEQNPLQDISYVRAIHGVVIRGRYVGVNGTEIQ